MSRAGYLKPTTMRVDDHLAQVGSQPVTTGLAMAGRVSAVEGFGKML